MWIGVIVAAALLGSCDAPPSPDSPEGGGAAVASAPETVKVQVKGEVFRLEAALDDATRFKGLGGRREIAPDGGMIFVFPYVSRHSFVMRDCPVAIDIAFLDPAGRVVAVHAMQPEAARGEDESEEAYEGRLRRYDSRFPAQFAVETAGGRLTALGLKPGDLLEFDAAGLKARVR